MNFIFNLFIFIFFLKLIISKEINSFLNDEIKNKINSNIQDSSIERIFDLPSIVFNILSNIIEETYFNPNDTHSDSYKRCVGMMVNKYSQPNARDLEKLYEGSSRGFIDISSFHNCINSKDKTNIQDNTTNSFEENTKYNFYTVYPLLSHKIKLEMSKLNKTSLFDNTWIFGFCMQNNICNEEALKEIVIEVNNKFYDNEIEVFKEYYNNTKHIGIIDNLAKSDRITKINSFKNFLRLISFILLLFQVLLITFKKIPEKMFGFCIKRKYLRDIKNDPKKIGYLLNNTIFTKKINKKIRECFSLSDNLDSFITNKKNDELFKDEDLTYIKGIKGIGAIFLIFGTTYIYFFNYPICISEKNERKVYMTMIKSLCLVVFWRIAPALLLSSSGFSLSYKFLNFLDKKLISLAPENIDIKEIKEEEKGDKEETEKILESEMNDNYIESKSSSKTDSTKNKAIDYYNKSNNDSLSRNNSNSESNSKSYYENTLGIKIYQKDLAQKTLNSMFGNQRINDSILLQRVSTDKIPYSILFNFLLRQTHKVFCIFIGIHFYKKFFPVIISLINRGAPLMNYLFTELIDKLDSGFGNFLYYQNFIDLFKKTDKEDLDEPNNKKISLLYVFSIIICETNYFIIGSILIFLCYKNKLSLDYIIIFSIILLAVFKIIYNFAKHGNNPGFFYFDSVYQRFFLNPIYNFSYFLIGLFYGIVNYVVQNDISKKETFTRERPMLGIPISISNTCDYKNSKNIVHFLLSLLLFIIILLSFPYFFKKNFEDIITEDDPSIIFTLISSIDVDCFLYLFHFFMIACYMSGRNMIFEFFNSNIWGQISKLYFWIILLTPIVNYYIIYRTETQLNLGFFIVMIYSAICGTNVYIISVAFFVILEIPYKKLIKLYFNVTSKINESDLEEDIDDEKNNKKYPLQKDSVMTELNEKDLEIKNNEEKEEDKDDDDKED